MRRLLATAVVVALIATGTLACGVSYEECAEIYGLPSDPTLHARFGEVSMYDIAKWDSTDLLMSERCKEAVEDELLRANRELDN